MARLTVERLIEKIILKIQDGDESDYVTPDTVMEELDQCNVDIATEVNIKELATVSEVTLAAGQNSVSLPSDFLNKQKSLSQGYNKSTNEHLKVYASRRLVDRRFRGISITGNAMIICDDFPNLYYQCSPSSDQLIDIYHFAVPNDLSENGNFPNYIPNNYIYRLYFHYACAQLFDYLEDGEEGEKVNTLYHEDKYSKNLKAFKAFIGPDPDDPFVIESPNISFNFEDY